MGLALRGGNGEGGLETGLHGNMKRNSAIRVGNWFGDNDDSSLVLLGLRKPQNKTFKDEKGVVNSIMLQKGQGE